MLEQDALFPAHDRVAAEGAVLPVEPGQAIRRPREVVRELLDLLAGTGILERGAGREESNSQTTVDQLYRGAPAAARRRHQHAPRRRQIALGRAPGERRTPGLPALPAQDQH